MGSNKPFAFTQHNGRSLLARSFRSFDSEVMGLLMVDHWLAATANSLQISHTDRLRHSRFCDIQIVIVLYY